MDGYIATVSSIVDTDENGDPATARVLPLTADGVVSPPFAVYWPMRSGDGQIAVGDRVVCLAFEDGTGLILSRPDGTWTNSFGDDVTAAGKSVAAHTHQGVHGATSAPI